MIALILKFFSAKRSGEAKMRSVTGKVCGVVGIFLNVLLFAVKLAAGLFSGSLSVTADAFNNLSDAGSSVVTLIGFKLSEKKPDRHHPFGHGRFEYISGLIVAFMILLMGTELAKTSVGGLVEPTVPEFGVLTTAVLVFSVLVKLYIYGYNTKYGKRISSSAMLATAKDSFSDIVSTTAVLVGSLIVKFGGVPYVDAVFGLAVSLFIIYSGFRVARETISPLLGQNPSAEFVKKVIDIARSDDKILGIHDLVVHDYGPGKVMVSLHCEVSCYEDPITLHEIIDRLEVAISEELDCMTVIHMDPVDTKDELLGELHKEIGETLKNLNIGASFHDLRIVRASDAKNVIFDLVLPADPDIKPEEIIRTVTKEITSKHPDYRCIIKPDRDYTGRI